MDEPVVSQSIVKGLANHLKANMASIQEARYNFPNPNEVLKYPCVTVFARTPTFQALSPYTISKDEPDQATGLAKYRRVIGQYDFSLQVDFWSSYKPQREQLHEEFMRAMSLDPNVTGLSLKLTDYFDQWARFDLDKVEFLDGEEQSQRNEWRVMATVLANVKVVREHSAHLMETIENTLTTPEEIAPPEDEGDTAIL